MKMQLEVHRKNEKWMEYSKVSHVNICIMYYGLLLLFHRGIFTALYDSQNLSKPFTS